MSLLPTPKASNNETRQSAGFGPNLGEALRLLPTRGGSGTETVELLPTPCAARAGRQRSASDGAAIRPTLDSIRALLPTPSVADATGGHERRGGGRGGELLLKGIARHEQFGKYAPAVARWEAIFGHPAPSPTEPGKHGKPRLNAAFAEWMMGIQPGWVTQVPGLTRNQQLHAIGNGVCPQQAAEALSLCLERLEGLDAA